MVTTDAAPQTGMDKLRALPVVDRIVMLLNMLNDLQRQNMELSGKVVLTKQVELDNAAYRAKAVAYRDTSVFVAQFFETELRERLLPPETLPAGTKETDYADTPAGMPA